MDWRWGDTAGSGPGCRMGRGRRRALSAAAGGSRHGCRAAEVWQSWRRWIGRRGKRRGSGCRCRRRRCAFACCGGGARQELLGGAVEVASAAVVTAAAAATSWCQWKLPGDSGRGPPSRRRRARAAPRPSGGLSPRRGALRRARCAASAPSGACRTCAAPARPHARAAAARNVGLLDAVAAALRTRAARAPVRTPRAAAP